MNRFSTSLVVVLVLATTACQDSLVTGPTESPPALSIAAQSGRQVVGQYIVVFNDDVTDPPGLARQLVAAQGGTLGRTWSTAIKGFSATLPDAAATALANNPNVAYVEPDREGGILTDQLNPTWGLDRIDQPSLPLDDTYSYDNDNNGNRATVYLLDTGVELNHNEFGGRAGFIPNGAMGNFVGDSHGSAEDCHGHGTHVAGTIGGSTYGVAKGVSIQVGRVVNCNGGGFVSTVITAVDWVTANHGPNSVVSMSLGYGNVQSLRDAVQTSVNEGVHYSVAAGNGNFMGRPQDACKESPAGAPGANTVGATNITDQEASFSNYGTCVDILAPGVAVESALLGGGSTTKSGTSMATPHVTGAIALYLTANTEASPAAVSAALQQTASVDKISLHRSSQRNGTPNLLLNTQGSPGPALNEAPVADFTFECTNLICVFTDRSNDDGGVENLIWEWDFGDDGMSDVQDPTHDYASAGEGTYRVTLKVTDADATPLSDSHSRQVTVPPSDPVVVGCAPDSEFQNERRTVTVTGSNFVSGATVSFGPRIAVQSVTFMGSNQLDVMIKIQRRADPGFRDVTVTNPDGGSGVGVGCFEVL